MKLTLEDENNFLLVKQAVTSLQETLKEGHKLHVFKNIVEARNMLVEFLGLYDQVKGPGNALIPSSIGAQSQ